MSIPSIVNHLPRNHILAGLTPDLVASMGPILVRVSLVSNQVLHERGQTIDDVFFLETGVASLTAETFDGAAVEVGMTGAEGMVGIPALLRKRPIASQRAFIQIPGEALRMTTASFTDCLAHSDAFRARCLDYADVMMNQTAQTAACNARHDVTERLARWLLMSQDRVGADVLPLTQEFLAFMLGVRRTGVAASASALQADELIQYSRGRITVLDRLGLEAAACPCYSLMRPTARRSPVLPVPA